MNWKSVSRNRKSVSPSLAELQRGLAARILGEEAPAVERWIGAPERPEEAARRIGVHTDGYPARVQEALREAFPAIAHILGHDTFAALARRFAFGATLAANLNAVGAGLAGLLERDPLGSDLPFLCDLARLEWAVATAFHAPTEPRFDAKGCEAWGPEDWAQLRLRFQPGTALVASAWPIHDLRAARDVPRDAIDVDLVDRPQAVLVFRRELDVSTERVPGDEALAFASLAAGEPLGASIAALAEAGGEPERVAALFARWSALGLLSAQPPQAGASYLGGTT